MLRIPLDMSLRTAFVLGLAGVAELRIGAMLEKQIRAFLIVKDAAQPVAQAGCRKVRRHAHGADRIHIHAEIDQLLKQNTIPTAVGGPNKAFSPGLFAIRLRFDARHDPAENLTLKPSPLLPSRDFLQCHD